MLVLTAAFFHAGWNIMLQAKGNPLRVSARSSALSTVAWAPIVVIVWLVAGRPGFSSTAWELAIVSAILELLYFIFLSSAYQRGELSSVYALARGTAPVLAVAVGVVVLREQLSLLESIGIVALIGGMWTVRRPQAIGTATVPALLTGVSIAAYSAIDSEGARVAAPWLYGFLVWMLTALLLNAYVFGIDRAGMRREQQAQRTSGAESSSTAEAIVIGILMTSTYLMVLIAYRLAPLAIVSPLRESAIVLVTLWGIWKSNEREQAWLRIGGAIVVATGAVLVAVG